MLSILRLTLKDKREYEFRTDSRVAEAIAMHHQDGGVFYSIEDREGLSVDFKSVIAVQILPFRPVTTVSKVVGSTPVMVSDARPPVVDKSEPLTYAPVKPESVQEIPKKLYKVECKCGADYFCRLFSDTTKCRCKECSETVFVDNFAPKRTGDNNQPATLVTNRYRVSLLMGCD